MKAAKRKFTLDRPATYQIRVPGRLDDSWNDWDDRMTVTIESKDDHLPVTTLTGTVDQAALHGLLRKLYSQGLPLISVTFIELGQADVLDSGQ